MKPARRPDAGRPVPTSTYRLQITPEFGFDDAAALVDYLHDLGVSHAYLSPVLQPLPGSTHGYDVVDHARLNTEAGGDSAFRQLVERLHAHEMGMVVDVVPNHMAVPTPAHLNAQLWSVLRDGPGSPYAGWFDVDWSVPSHALLMPVLGLRIGQVLAASQLSLGTGGPGGDEIVLRYFSHELPVRPGTESLPLAELVDRQWYRLAHWRVADEELNYRRFFDVDTLAAVRVEDEEVFDATHRVLLDLVADGSLDGLRIDHPDGLADPRGYLARLAERTRGSWVVVEKILEGSETLPDDWRCAGTTGYDSLLRVGGLFVDPAGAAPLSALLTELTDDPPELGPVVEEAKREVVAGGLYAEVHRLVDLLRTICDDDVRLRDHTPRALHEAVRELLVAMDRYRAYVAPGEPAPAASVQAVEAAAEIARDRLPDFRHDTVDLVRDLALGREVGTAGKVDDPRRAEFLVRFQQTCGPVMAKGVEDTAFYRWFRLASLDEVGGDPARFGVAGEEVHAFSERLQREWPTTMTTLSTHDTKRSEDVRARLAVLSEVPIAWSEAVRAWWAAATDHRDPLVDPRTEYLVWQTLVGTWPIDADRLNRYVEKAVREAKVRTSWTSPDADYEAAVHRFVDGVVHDASITTSVQEFVRRTAEPVRAGLLGQKLVQLLMPGVPDVYQGTELVDLSLVDPDNRRPVDFAERRARLARLDAGANPRDLDDEKLLVTSRTLRLRRDHPEWFVGEQAQYHAVATTTGNAFALGRGDDGLRVVGLVTRLAVSLGRYGGWQDHTVTLPEGLWHDALTGCSLDGGPVRLADLLTPLPVALLVRT
jgi:(1->4)-alpha-D-glucan 1-alpha-D-glucosylmutase